ncbi:MAG: UDP-N-acetylmuramoyl-L-alanine--D-glutamate ligase [Myxococcota bacterium]|nr:UDP-N-acetylmuramoyl-L-alanine--D-glutamate ligase [Myxococcota bacterium]
MTSLEWQISGQRSLGSSREEGAFMSAINRVEQARALREELKGKSVAVWGAALSGIAAANCLSALGAEVSLSDLRSRESLGDLKQLDPRVTLYCGENRLGKAEILVPSPGLRPSLPPLQRAREAGVRIMSEVELGTRLSEAPIIAITGTDGKSTSTLFCHGLLQGLGRRARAVGNIGDPITAHALDASHDEILVLEVSAFQLWSAEQLPVEVSALTNIAEDHHDYFDGDGASYRAAKLRLFQLQHEAALAGKLSCSGRALFPTHQPLPLSPDRLTPLTVELYGDSPAARWRADGGGLFCGDERLLEESWCQRDGAHQARNLLLALAAVDGLGALGRPGDRPSNLAAVVAGLKTPPHRRELIRIYRGVRWINDSKATNVHAARVGLEGLEGSLLVIAGGVDKGLDLSELVEVLSTRARVVFLIGELAERLEHALAGRCALRHVGHLEAAVAAAAEEAREGETVTLSPAASSFDQFSSFEARGDLFRALVEAL